MQWRSIEDAPKNGQDVLFHFEETGEVLIGCWNGFGWWCATYQTGGEKLNPSSWSPIKNIPGTVGSTGVKK